MNKDDARDAAKYLLQQLITDQPNLIQFSTPSGYGADAAQFCIDFIETYENWLMRSEK